MIVIDIVEKLIEKNTTPESTPNLVVFVDIGGNRELEALVALLPWVASSLPQIPRRIVVKSETMHTAMTAGNDWTKLKA